MMIVVVLIYQLVVASVGILELLFAAGMVWLNN